MDTITYNSTLSAVGAGEEGNWLLSGLILAALQDRQLSSDVIGYTAAITCCEQASEWQQAAAMMIEMTKHRARVDSLAVSLVTNACQRESGWQQILTLLRDQREQSVAINVLAYNLAMASCLGEWQHVLALLETLRAETVRANAITYTLCLDACENGGQLRGCPAFSHDLGLAGLLAVCTLSSGVAIMWSCRANSLV